MKILIRKDAVKRYIKDTLDFQINHEWKEMLRKIEGKEIQVETDYLFNDQYNTVPIEGVSESGLRIMQYMVEKVIDDERIGKMRCQYCGKTSEIADECPKCHKSEYLQIFDVNKKVDTEKSITEKLDKLMESKIGGKQNIRKKIGDTFIKEKVQYHINKENNEKDLITTPIFDINLYYDERNRIKDYSLEK